MKRILVVLGLTFAFTSGAAFVTASAQKRDCRAWCTQARCVPTNIGAGGSVGYCMSRCVPACNQKNSK
jgi:hypothetical protein